MPLIKDEHYFKSLAKELDSKLDRINSLIDNHPSEKGSYHEYVLRDLIKNFLPNRFSLKTGFIYFDKDNISPQIDLMVIDENESGCILARYDDFVIIYPEAVCCVIKIKTSFSKQDFIDSTSLIQKVKKISIANTERHGVIGGLIFAFRGEKLSPSKLNKWYKSKQPCQFAEYPETILCLREGMITKKDINGEKWGHYFVTGDNDELKWKSLSIFLASIIKYCDLKSDKPQRNSFERYAYIHELMTSGQYLRYGNGLLLV
ncbi:MAG: DUF6602 domain-containing protein [Microgenomates group bacterium]|jgi:hypothetical protein